MQTHTYTIQRYFHSVVVIVLLLLSIDDTSLSEQTIVNEQTLHFPHWHAAKAMSEQTMVNETNTAHAFPVLARCQSNEWANYG